MIFQRRYEKQMQHIREQRGATETLEERSKLENVLEKGDVPAMSISALLVIVPVCLAVLVVVSLAGYFFIAR